jgi:hypothetical protein
MGIYGIHYKSPHGEKGTGTNYNASYPYHPRTSFLIVPVSPLFLIIPHALVLFGNLPCIKKKDCPV